MVYVKNVLRSGMDAQCLQLLTRLREEREINNAIARADPLGVDQAMQELPYLNEQKNTEGIREHLEQAIARAKNQITGDFIHASAAIRDICMFAGSLVSYGIEPTDCVQDFSEVLLALSTHVKSSLPRDSFIDYTSRNPEGKRERRFISRPEEGVFIDSLRRGMIALDNALMGIIQAYYHPLASSLFADSCSEAARGFQDMIDAIVQVKRGITPEVFTHYIRPFFEPFNVFDKAYSAPSGAEMSILNIDLIIWGADCKDELYTTYVRANIKRLPTVYQEIYHLFSGEKSLITMMKEHCTSISPLHKEERNSIQALNHLVTKLYSFRMPHYKVAEDNVKLRFKEMNGEEVKGSSGFGIDEVKYVLDQTIKSRQLLAQLLAC